LLRLNVIVLLSLSWIFTSAQNQLGLQLSNYSGTSGLGYNPSSFHASNLDWDFCLVSGGTFAETDYIFLQNTCLIQLLSTDKPLVNFKPENEINTSDFIYYQFTDAKQNMQNSNNAFLGSPAFSKRINKNISVGFYAKVRQALSSNQLDFQLSEPSVSSWQIPDRKTIKPTRTTGMVWTEYAANFAYGFKNGNKVFSYGLNAKVLVGNQAVFIHSPNPVSLTKLDSNLETAPSTLEYGFTYVDEQFNLKNNGNGFGVDFGFTIQDKNYFEEPNTWRASFAVADLGFVNFKSNSEYHIIKTAQSNTIPENTFDQTSSIQEFSRELSNALTGNPIATYNGPRFTIYTPTAINLDLDYHLTKHVFANLHLSRRFIISPKQIEKENIVVTSIRYETRFFELGLPFTLYNDNDLRLGLWVRIGPIIIGSDNFAPIFIEQNQLSGADIYFAIRINNLNTNLKNNKNRSQKERCYW
jgi:hypothetical protein